MARATAEIDAVRRAELRRRREERDPLFGSAALRRRLRALEEPEPIPTAATARAVAAGLERLYEALELIDGPSAGSNGRRR
jgi:hypothetical protein